MVRRRAVAFLWVLVVAVSGATTCKRDIFPGLERMRYGVDLSTYSLFPTKTRSKGAALPLIEFGCSRGQTQSVNGIEYDIPDAFPETIPAVPATVTDAGELFALSTSSYQEQTARLFSGLKPFPGFASASEAYGAASKTLLEGERAVAAVTSTVAAFAPSFRPSWSAERPRLYSDAQDYVNAFLLPCPAFNLTCFEAYNTFFETYGTDFVQESCQGGAIRLEYATAKAFVFERGQEYVSKQGQLAFLAYLKAIGAYSGPVDPSDEKWEKATIASQYTMGGAGQPSPSNYHEWSKSVLSFSQTVPCGPGKPALQLSSISALLPPSLTTAFEAARTNYYNHKFLSEEVLPTLPLLEAALYRQKEQPRECAQPDELDCTTNCQKVGFLCDGPASCCSSNCAWYTGEIERVIRRADMRLNQAKDIRANATLLTVQPIVDNARVQALAAQFVELSLAVQSPLKTLQAVYQYNRRTDTCGGHFTCRSYEICLEQPREAQSSTYRFPERI